MIKKGLKVLVLTGKDKKKEGEVIEIDRRGNRAKIKDINMVKKHVKTTKEKKGGIFPKESFIHLSNLKLIDHEVAKERLIKVQKILFKYQLNHNESFLGKKINVLVENKMKKNQMYFGRNEYLNGVIFDGNEKLLGKIVKIKIALMKTLKKD